MAYEYMKINNMKYILTIPLIAITLFAKAQTTTNYVELNTGFSTGVIPAFPGASVLYGATSKWESGFIFDYEAGIAFPTLVTGKMGVGYDIDGTEATVGIRPWPPTTYAQVRINRPTKVSDVVLSVEGMLWSEYLFVQRAVFTIGWRWKNKSQNKTINKLQR